MKRSSVQIAMVVLAHLAAGATVTVLVSWAIAIWLPMPHHSRYVASTTLPKSMHMVPLDWPPPIIAARARAVGRAETQAQFDDSDVPWQDARCMVRHAQQGWPFLAMENWFLIEMPKLRPGQTVWENGIPIPLSFPRFMPENTPYFGNLPIRPDLPGFLFNCLFYGGLLFAARAIAQRLRRAIRRRRGQCAACGYDITNLMTCPECGRVANNACASLV